MDEIKKPTVWRTSDGREIPFNEMSVTHLRKAFINVNIQDLRVFNKYLEISHKMEVIDALKKKLLEEANRRKVRLKYPDEDSNSKDKFGTYFANDRKHRGIEEIDKVSKDE